MNAPIKVGWLKAPCTVRVDGITMKVASLERDEDFTHLHGDVIFPRKHARKDTKLTYPNWQYVGIM